MSRFCIESAKLYEKDSKLKREDVNILQEWLQKQPHLPLLEESQIAIFLHSCYYNIEAAKKTIDCYFTRKTLHPEIFRCPSEHLIRRVLSVVFVRVLPETTPEGYRVVLMKLLDTKSEKYNFLETVLVINMVSALYWHQIGISNGIISVYDLKGATLGHVARVNLPALKQALGHLQEGIPVRLMGTHFVNTVPFTDKILTLVKPFMSSGLFSKIQLHSSLDSLYKYIPKKCLPADYGGDLPTCKVLQEENIENILSNMDFFKWHDSQSVDESRRTEKRFDNNYGLEGTFKKLELD